MHFDFPLPGLDHDSVPPPFLQVWGVLLGIGNETYTKSWNYVGPGIAYWEVSFMLIHSCFCVCTVSALSLYSAASCAVAHSCFSFILEP